MTASHWCILGQVVTPGPISQEGRVTWHQHGCQRLSSYRIREWMSGSQKRRVFTGQISHKHRLLHIRYFITEEIMCGWWSKYYIFHLLFLFLTNSESRATILMESSAVILGPDMIVGLLHCWKTMAKMTCGFWHASTLVLSCPDALLVGQRENGDGALLHMHLYSLIETFHESW